MSDYTIVFDGGCKSNPGQMYGSYELTARTGLSNIQRCYFTYGTSNQAEYLSLITALS